MGDPDPTPSPVAIVAPIKPDTVVMPGFSYLGCYVDSVDRVLTGTHFPKMHTMSTMVCDVCLESSVMMGGRGGYFVKSKSGVLNNITWKLPPSITSI